VEEVADGLVGRGLLGPKTKRRPGYPDLREKNGEEI
jgi:hypothetical protein